MFLPRSPAQTVRSQLFEAEAAPAAASETPEPGRAGPSAPPAVPDAARTAEQAERVSSAVSPAAEARASAPAERVALRERPPDNTSARAIARAELEALCAAHADDPIVQTLLARARALDAALELRAAESGGP